ncbi:hypothetical protein [Burkholderia sp. AU16741]|uniref:hypothetical protein n=1 Tax=Burkholderia sp. AU16741 TaxID=2015347 RepID=UPI00117FC2BD|nr:hypothetical protein [Burkholderia sp. AU16741]
MKLGTPENSPYNSLTNNTAGASGMLVIKLIIAIAAIAAIVFGVLKFNKHCLDKFGHAFFTKPAFYATAAALVLLIAGNYWRHSAEISHGDTLNGIALMALGAAVACWLVYVNIRRTDVIYGIGGSVVQLGLFSALAWVSLPLMALVLIGQFLLIMSAKPVYVVNR